MSERLSPQNVGLGGMGSSGISGESPCGSFLLKALDEREQRRMGATNFVDKGVLDHLK